MALARRSAEDLDAAINRRMGAATVWGPSGPLVCRSRNLSGRTTAHLLAPMALDRPRGRARRAGPVRHVRPRRIPDLSAPCRGRNASRLSQCLPAPGVQAADGAERALPRHRVPLSRLALPRRRHPRSRAAVRRDTRLPERRAVALPHLGRDLAGPSLRLPGPGRLAPCRMARPDRGHGRANCAGTGCIRAASGISCRLQLEDLCRQFIRRAITFPRCIQG